MFFLQGDPTYLIVTQEGAIEKYGLNAVCTHLGCVVPWVAVSVGAGPGSRDVARGCWRAWRRRASTRKLDMHCAWTKDSFAATASGPGGCSKLGRGCLSNPGYRVLQHASLS